MFTYFYSIDFNYGLKVASDALKAPLGALRIIKYFDSNGEEVYYGPNAYLLPSCILLLPRVPYHDQLLSLILRLVR